MIDCRFGDVVLVPFPFTHQTTTKRRPAAVVSSATYHAERPDVIILAITSRSRPACTVGEAPIQDWHAAGLLRTSVFKPLVTTLERDLVLRKLGHLTPTDCKQLRSILDAILGE